MRDALARIATCGLFIFQVRAMANPQAEDGYTRIANEIMDALARIRIPGEARQVLDVILRKTYGWNKRTDRISLSQFVEGTGLSKVHISQAIDKLINLNLIITEKGKGSITEKGKAISYIYEFNKDFDSWQPLPKKVTLPKKVKSITEKGNKPLPKKGTTKDTIQKKEKKKKDMIFFLPEDIDKNVWNAFVEMRSKIKKPLTEYAKILIVEELNKIGQDKNEVLKKSIENSWQGVFPLKEQTQVIFDNPADAIAKKLQEMERWKK